MILPLGGHGGSSASHYTQHSSSSGNNGIGLVGVYPTVGGGSSSSHFSEQSSSDNHGFGSGFGSGVGLSSRFSGGSGFGHTSSGLAQYMSQSERLAHLQAQSGGGYGSQRGSSNVDYVSGNSFGNNLATGGYGKVKSWETSSKWGSQSEVNPHKSNSLTLREYSDLLIFRRHSV